MLFRLLSKFSMFKVYQRFLNNENRKQFLSNFLGLGVLNSVSYIIPLVTIPYLTATVGIAAFGKIQFITVFFVFISQFIDAGFYVTGAKLVATSKSDMNLLAKRFWGIITIKLCLLTLALLLISLALTITELLPHDWITYACGLPFLLGQVFSVDWYFRGINRLKLVVRYTIAGRFLYLILLIASVRGVEDTNLAIFVYSISFAFSGIVTLIIVAHKIGNVPFLWKNSSQFLWSMLKSSLPTSGYQLVANFHRSGTVLVFGFILSEELLGIYSAIFKVINAAVSILLSLSGAAYSLTLSVKSEVKKVFYYTEKLLIGNILLFIGAGIGIFLFQNIIFERVLHLENFVTNYSFALALMLLYLPAAAINSLLAGTLITIDYEKKLLRNILLGSVIFVIYILLAKQVNILEWYFLAMPITEVFNAVINIQTYAHARQKGLKRAH